MRGNIATQTLTSLKWNPAMEIAEKVWTFLRSCYNVTLCVHCQCFDL